MLARMLVRVRGDGIVGVHLTATQTPATRAARIARGRDKIIAGKGQSER